MVGVIPQSLMQRELGHPGLSELHVVQTMHERKRLMAEFSDAFLALPGGIGTMEELFEVWTWRHLGHAIRFILPNDRMASLPDGPDSGAIGNPAASALVQ